MCVLCMWDDDDDDVFMMGKEVVDVDIAKR